MALSLGLVALAGCGGSSNSTPPPPSITSFAASPAAIEAGSSATLTAVFVNGTGTITPGNIAVTSGTPITVSPTATTTYTLTVTPSSGDAVTATTTVTVSAVPAIITSFVAAPPTIETGTSSSLTAVFSGGTGVISPGDISVTSGTAVSVSPTTMTTYTLTVTPAAGTPVTATVTVNVDPAPAIASFVANPTTIEAGSSTSLTAVFSGGSGVINPGNITVVSGIPAQITPTTTTTTTTTTYTLTVTPPIGAAITQSVTVTVDPIPTITSFVASPTNIATGSSSNLTAVFTGGTGVITPGNLSVTSGVAVSVSPTATTTYILTVTPPVGAITVTQTAIVTVGPAPVITSFGATPTSITAGQSANLTGVFSNGAGVITPGNLTASSGTPVTVSPTTTTTYTLTVTSNTGTPVTATATATVTVTAVPASTVTVNLASTGPAVTDQLIGMNMAVWNNTTLAEAVSPFQAVGVKAVRWPGGSTSDSYHWEGAGNDPSSPSICPSGYAFPNATFANFVNDLVIPAGLDIALTANYGSNEACNGGGDPAEAAAWVANALTLGVTVSHMTVGNEEYGNWEYDLHSTPNDPTIYAAAVGTSTGNGYYKQIKTASPSTLVGVVVDAGSPSYGGVFAANWDPTVLANSQYDFVEYHYYAQNPGNESDTFLVHSAAQGVTTGIKTIKAELTAAGKPNTPIYVGEMGSASSNPGKQSWSITQGLFAGQMLGEMMNDGVARATWWIGFGNCNGTAGNDSSGLYGWQNFGAYNVFSDGSADSTCPGAGSLATLSPTAVAFQLFSKVAVTGESALTASVSGDTTDVRAYAATNSGGTALVLFNLNETTSEPITITLTGQSAATTITETTYDKAIYDLSGSPTGTFPDPAGTSTWAPPTTTSLGAQTLPLTLTLSPWSMNVIIIH